MAVTEQDITLALQTVADPLTGQDFVAAKAIKHLSIQDGVVSFDLVLGYPAKSCGTLTGSNSNTWCRKCQASAR